MSALLDMQASIVSAIDALLPELNECTAHPGRFTREELARFRSRAPSVHVALSSVRNPQLEDGDVVCEVKTVIVICAKNAVVDNKAVNRADAAVNIVTAILAEVPKMRLGAGVYRAKDIAADNLYGVGDSGQGVAMWAIHWTNKICLPVVKEDGALPSALYLSFAPDIGADHEDDYELVAGSDDG